MDRTPGSWELEIRVDWDVAQSDNITLFISKLYRAWSVPPLKAFFVVLRTTSRRVITSNEYLMSPCVSMVNPKLLLLIFSSHHVVFKEARLINNISTRNAVCVISGRHLMVSEITNPPSFQQEGTCWSYKTTLHAKYWSEMTFHKLAKQPK